MGIVVGIALAIANWGHRRWVRKQNPTNANREWDGVYSGYAQAEAADAFVKGLPRALKGDSSS